jgi:hypothetical protein
LKKQKGGKARQELTVLTERKRREGEEGGDEGKLRNENRKTRSD